MQLDGIEFLYCEIQVRGYVDDGVPEGWGPTRCEVGPKSFFMTPTCENSLTAAIRSSGQFIM